MPYLGDDTRRLGIKLSAVPQDDVASVASFAELRFVSDKVKFFDPQSNPLLIDDDAMHDLVEALTGTDKGRQLYEWQMHYPCAVPIKVSIYYIVENDPDPDDEYLIWEVTLSPKDNPGYGSAGFYVLDGCGNLKTSARVCSAGGAGISGYDIGDESSTTFFLTNPFRTYDLVWAARENDSPFDYVDVDLSLPTTTTINVTGFVTAPDADEYRVLIAEGDFAQSFGNGSDTSFTIQHNLGTQDVLCSVWEAAAPRGSVSVDIARTDANNVTVSGFVVAPTTNQYRLVVRRSGSTVAGGFTGLVGDGASTSLTVTHNKDSQDIIPSLYEAASPYADVSATIAAATTDTATVSGFGSPPTLNQYRFVMQK